MPKPLVATLMIHLRFHNEAISLTSIDK